MKASPKNSGFGGQFCYRHPKTTAVTTIQGLPSCSECAAEAQKAERKRFRKANATRRRNAASRLEQRSLNDRRAWEIALRQELAKPRYRGVLEVFERPDRKPHVPELLGRIFQYCAPPLRRDDLRIPQFRRELLRAAKQLQDSAQCIRDLREFDSVHSDLRSYVQDQLALKPSIASQAGTWLPPELRESLNARWNPLEPERLMDEAHHLASLATALGFLSKSLAKKGDFVLAPLLAYTDMYLRKLLPAMRTSSLLLKLVNAGFAAHGSRHRMTASTLSKRLRDYRKQHPITVRQLQLRTYLMIEGAQVLEKPGVRAYTDESEMVRLPSGTYGFLPRVPLLPPAPRHTNPQE